MNHLFRVLSLSVLLAVSNDAGAEQIREMAGVSIALGDFSGVLYYVPDPDGYRVVVTVSSGDRAAPLRFVTTLAGGQSAVFSIPGPIEAPDRKLRIVRTGDRTFVQTGSEATVSGP